MQTNHISHFLLTRELFPLLEKSDDPRVINHSSIARYGPPLGSQYLGKNGGNLGGDKMPMVGMFNGPRWERYHQTKLANCLFTYALKAKVEAAGKKIKSLVAHPGLAATQLQVTTVVDGGMGNWCVLACVHVWCLGVAGPV